MGLGQQPSTGTALVAVDSSTAFVLHAVNAYGTTRESVSVRVLPLPELRFVPVPTTPSLRFHTEIPVVGLGGNDPEGWFPVLHAALSSPVAPGMAPLRPAPVPLALGFAEGSASTVDSGPAFKLFDLLANPSASNLGHLIEAIPPAPDASTLLHHVREQP